MFLRPVLLMIACLIATGCDAERRAVAPVQQLLADAPASMRADAPSKPGRLERVLAEASRPSPDSRLTAILFNNRAPTMSQVPMEVEDEQDESCPYEITEEESMRTGA